MRYVLLVAILLTSAAPAAAQISQETDELLQRNLRNQESRELREFVDGLYDVEPLFPNNKMEVNVYDTCAGMVMQDTRVISAFVTLAIAKRAERTTLSREAIAAEWLSEPLPKLYNLALQELAR